MKDEAAGDPFWLACLATAEPYPCGWGVCQRTAETRRTQRQTKLRHLRICHRKVIGLGSLSLPLFSALFASLRFNGASVNCMDTPEWCRAKGAQMQTERRKRHPLQHASATGSWQALQDNRAFRLGKRHPPAHRPNRWRIKVIPWLLPQLQDEFRLLREWPGIVQAGDGHLTFANWTSSFRSALSQSALFVRYVARYCNNPGASSFPSL